MAVSFTSLIRFPSRSDSARGSAAPAGSRDVLTGEVDAKLDRVAGLELYERDDALREEAKGIARMAGTPTARHLVGLFLGDQVLGKTAKALARQGGKVERAAVLGAGIMGGGIAYQSALKGTPIIMKDIAQAGIDLGLSEASKLLSKRVDRGRMSPAEMAGVLSRIQPSLGYDGFDTVDIVVEAVVENPKVKHAVLAETETQIRDDAILASNTSTISITHLAEPLKRPENF